MPGIKVRDLSEEFSWGSVVEGVDWDTLKDEAVRDQLRRLFDDRGLIVFEGCEPSAKFQVALSTVFGPLKDHPTRGTPRVEPDSAPGVIDMHSYPREVGEDKRGLVQIDGRILTRFSPWHFDHCYNDELNYAGVLRCVINAPEGGRTGFCDGVELYNQISPALRDKIDGLNVIYTLDTRLTTMRFGRSFRDFGEAPGRSPTLEEAKHFPRAMHPAVWTRPNGDKCLHVGAWMAVGIEHHEDDEGDALLEAVCQQINHRAHAYWHDWKPTDMVIWDNLRMLHAVEGNDPAYERQTQRTTIRGDYGLGYFEHGKKIGEVTRELA